MCSNFWHSIKRCLLQIQVMLWTFHQDQCAFTTLTHAVEKPCPRHLSKITHTLRVCLHYPVPNPSFNWYLHCREIRNLLPRGIARHHLYHFSQHLAKPSEAPLWAPPEVSGRSVQTWSSLFFVCFLTLRRQMMCSDCDTDLCRSLSQSV